MAASATTAWHALSYAYRHGNIPNSNDNRYGHHTTFFTKRWRTDDPYLRSMFDWAFPEDVRAGPLSGAKGKSWPRIGPMRFSRVTAWYWYDAAGREGAGRKASTNKIAPTVIHRMAARPVAGAANGQMGAVQDALPQ